MRHGAPHVDQVRGWAFRTEVSYRRNLDARVENVSPEICVSHATFVMAQKGLILGREFFWTIAPPIP